MTVNVCWTISCENWLDSDIGECDISCNAYNEGDGFTPEAGWVSVEIGFDEDGGEYYCAKCADRLGKVDVHA